MRSSRSSGLAPEGRPALSRLSADRVPLARRAAFPMVLVVAALLVSGCSLPGFGTPEAITKQGDNIDRLWKGSATAGLIVGAIVWGLILWSVFRYRKRGDELPKQVQYNLPIELLYTAIPFMIVGLLFYYTAFSENYVNRLSANPDVTIGVVGFRWNWQFDYVGQNLQVTGRPGEPAQLILPTGRTIRFIETSPDVVHSFWVPEFLFKRDVIPGRTNQFEITIDKPGTYIGRCAELCGVDHDRMNFSVKVVSPQEYDSFVAAQQRNGQAQASGGASALPAASAAAGRTPAGSTS